MGLSDGISHLTPPRYPLNQLSPRCFWCLSSLWAARVPSQSRFVFKISLLLVLRSSSCFIGQVGRWRHDYLLMLGGSWYCCFSHWSMFLFLFLVSLISLHYCWFCGRLIGQVGSTPVLELTTCWWLGGRGNPSLAAASVGACSLIHCFQTNILNIVHLKCHIISIHHRYAVTCSLLQPLLRYSRRDEQTKMVVFVFENCVGQKFTCSCHSS